VAAVSCASPSAHNNVVLSPLPPAPTPISNLLELPDEVVCWIMSFLPLQTLCASRAVCHDWLLAVSAVTDTYHLYDSQPQPELLTPCQWRSPDAARVESRPASLQLLLLSIPRSVHPPTPVFRVAQPLRRFRRKNLFGDAPSGGEDGRSGGSGAGPSLASPPEAAQASGAASEGGSSGSGSSGGATSSSSDATNSQRQQQRPPRTRRARPEGSKRGKAKQAAFAQFCAKQASLYSDLDATALEIA
jgi:hypothetical protein